jgi:MFS family permease
MVAGGRRNMTSRPVPRPEPAPVVTSRSKRSPRGRGPQISRRASFWVVTGLLFALSGAVGAPAPLYAVYQARWHFSAATLTVVFAVYVLTLLVTLLTVGSLSDHVGRRPVMAAALAMAAVAAILFAAADGVGSLIVARAVQGVAFGLTSGSLVAAMLDLRPQGSVAPLISSIAPTLGVATGALATSALVEYAPDPTRLVWWLLFGAFAIGLALVPGMPEPGHRRPGAIASLAPRLRIPPSSRAAFIMAAPCLIGLWALGGFYLSLGPSLTGELVHSHNLIWGGLLIFLLMATGALVSTVSRNQLPRRIMTAGCAGLLVGTAISVAAIATRTPWLLFAGTAVAGAGFGAAFSGAYRTIIVSAPEHDRAELIAAIFTMSYTAFAIPALIAGIAATHSGLRPTAIVYAAAVAVLAAAALVSLIARRGRDLRPHAAPPPPSPPGPCTIPPCLPADAAERLPEAVSR